MQRGEFGAVEVFHADRNQYVREGMRTALHAAGVRNLTSFADLKELRAAMSGGGPDLLIASDDLGPGIYDMVRQIRQLEVGRNPFLLIALTVGDERFTNIRRAMLSGADDVVVGAVSLGLVLKRAVFLAHHRPFFIATFDYLGPERRRKAHGRIKIPHFAVLNTFADKLDGAKVTRADMKRRIREGMLVAMSAKLQSEGRKLGWASGLISEAYRGARIDKQVQKYLQIIAETLKDAGLTAKRLRRVTLAKHCASLLPLIGKAADHYDSLTEGELTAIRDLAKSYQQAHGAK